MNQLLKLDTVKEALSGILSKQKGPEPSFKPKAVKRKAKKLNQKADNLTAEQ